MGGGKRVRKMVLGDEIWMFNIRESDVRIFAPGGQVHEVAHWDLLGVRKEDWPEMWYQRTHCGAPRETVAVTPALIKKYILGLKEALE